MAYFRCNLVYIKKLNIMNYFRNLLWENDTIMKEYPEGLRVSLTIEHAKQYCMVYTEFKLLVLDRPHFFPFLEIEEITKAWRSRIHAYYIKESEKYPHSIK